MKSFKNHINEARIFMDKYVSGDPFTLKNDAPENNRI